MLFVCYPKCSTCQKAKAWLQERGVAFDERDIKQDNPTEQELRICFFALYQTFSYLTR